MEGPLNIIADTFSRLLHNENKSSALVGKKATSVVSNSESKAEYSSLIDDREILECLLNLSCLHSKKGRVKKTKEMEKIGTL